MYVAGKGGARCGLSAAEVSSACEMLASDTFLCVIYSTLLYFYDQHIKTSNMFAIGLIPKGSFAVWVASKMAQFDFAWSSVSKDSAELFEWSSQQLTQQR